MRKLYIIGIGAGNPEHVTVQAIKAMNKADVFFLLNKGESKDDLVRLRKEICERYIDDPSYRTVEIADPVRDPATPSYTSRVEEWHERRAVLYEEAIAANVGEEECGAVLVWGDPMLYDSTIRVFDRMIARGNISFDYEVIPGITSVQALAAAHKIVLNGIGESVVVTTGRRLADGQFNSAENIVVMLDGSCSFKDFPDAESDIYWGAYVGTDKEILLTGKLGEIAEHIEVARNEARERNGWIMDVYLLRRSQ
ncbi:precorrin-6A synthase (deacetylating) [Granulicella sp. dw_53]|uniref:precorrin-6A synthase (deacetylating) n=1 Tax=Granulicella sp. dw_53 TaxID=2719792 RepID=UPI001BD6214B|nr:precorrin-6A synthase (deacetylating) [Granulicella sp. dw_53]